MYTFLPFVFIIACVGIIALIGIITLAGIILEGFLTHQQLSQYAQDILDENLFYLKSNPAITCKILAVHRTGYKKPNMTLEVTYPDKSICELLTPMTEFQNLWLKI